MAGIVISAPELDGVDAPAPAGPHISIDLEPVDPPPPVPYVRRSEGVIYHDRRLSEDGEALYRFLRAEAQDPPSYVLTISGTHTEHLTRQVSHKDDKGKITYKTEHYTKTVTDFDFPIDLATYLVRGPVYWTLPDSDPAYRGFLWPEVDFPRRRATEEEIQTYHDGERDCRKAGVAPWQTADGSVRSESVASSLTLRQWADEYAASPKLLKEFVYDKVIYGWNETKLSKAIKFAIASTPYEGEVLTKFSISNNKVTIRPNNILAYTRSSCFLRFLLTITLIYPFILLFKVLHRRGGGKWKVIRIGYGLMNLEPLDTPTQAETSAAQLQGKYLGQRQRIVEAPSGLQKLTGYREGEWYREWKPAILHCVKNRLETKTPMTYDTLHPKHPKNPEHALEGYVPTDEYLSGRTPT